MSDKNLVILGTAHTFQADTSQNPWATEFKELLQSLIEVHSIQIILEEWSEKQGASIGQNLQTDHLKWGKISPPLSDEYSTEAPPVGLGYGPDVPKYLYVRQYPYQPQEKRETFMVESIKEAMNLPSHGLVIVGMSHVHSLMAKLIHAGFDVIAGNWLQACDRGQKLFQICEPPGSQTTV